MTYLVILGAYFAILAVLGVLSRKSLGVPTLALAAGAIMAQLWTDTLTPMVAGLGLALVRPPLSSIMTATLTILPALLVMARAPKAKKWGKSLVSGVVFAAAAVALTYPAYERAVVLDDPSKGVVEQMTLYIPTVITACFVVAILEILFRKKKAKLPDELSKQHKK